MRAVLSEVSYRYTLGAEEPIEFNFSADKWHNRDRKHTSKKWRSLTSKVFFKDKYESDK